MDGRDVNTFDPRRVDFQGVIRYRVPARELGFVVSSMVVIAATPLAGYALTGHSFWGLLTGGALGVAEVVVAERVTRRHAWGRPRSVTVEVIEQEPASAAPAPADHVAELVEFAPGVVVEKVRHTAA